MQSCTHCDLVLFLYILNWNFTPKWLNVSEAMSGCTFQWALVPTKWRNAIYVSASIQSEAGRPTCPNICVWSILSTIFIRQQNDKVGIFTASLSLSSLSYIHAYMYIKLLVVTDDYYMAWLFRLSRLHRNSKRQAYRQISQGFCTHSVYRRTD